LSLKSKDTTGRIQEKHITIKRKKSKNVMKKRIMRTIIGNHLMEQGIKEEGLQLHHHPLNVFEASAISFSPNTAHQAKWNHPPNSFALSTTKLPSQTSEEISHSTRHVPN
jgi:hypothetical protein